MRRSLLLTTLTLLGVLILAACDGSDAGDETSTTSTVGDQATTTTLAPTRPIEIPDFPFPVPDGASSVTTSEEGVLELGYPGDDAEQIAAFYAQWTTEQGSWTPQEPNPEMGLIASFLADNEDTIDVLRETPESETIVLLVALGG